MAKVTMPQLGESVAEGTIGKWLKQPGDAVAKYEPLLEVITDKVNAEVPSPFAGILREILVEEGATVPNNAEIAVIETAEETAAGAGVGTPAPAAASASKTAPASAAPASAAPASAAPAAPVAPAATTAPPKAAASSAPASPAASRGNGAGAADGPSAAEPMRPVPPTPLSAVSPTPPPAPAPAASASVGTATPETGEGEGRMTPAVRRLLREHGLSAAQIVGTGGGGRITREDVLNYVESARTGQAVQGQTATTSAQRTPGMPAAAPAGMGPTAPRAASTPGPAPAAPAGASPAAPTPSASLAQPAAAASARGIPGQKVTFPEGADEVLVPMTQMRKGIAAAMTRALAIPQAYVQVEVNASRLVSRRESAKLDYQAREGLSLSYVPFVVKAAVAALTKHPAFNAHWTEQGLLAKRRINMGVAVAVSDGLIVPVIHDADQLSIAGINRAIADVAARARANKLQLNDLQGSTFTIDNTGWFGSNITLPIINPPEVGILTMEAITKRPVVVETEDGDTLAVRPVMNMVIAIDHRANDGAQAAAFLNDVKAWIESISPDFPIY